MASGLVEKARKIGGDDLAEQVEQIEREIANVADLDQTLIEEVGLSEDAVAGMTPQAKREVAEMEKTNTVDIPIAGGSPEKTNAVEIPERKPETYTEEVPIEGGDDPETITVERQRAGPSIEAINEFHGWLNQARHEASKTTDEKRSGGVIPNMGYMNTEDVEGDDDIPAPGQVYRDE